LREILVSESPGSTATERSAGRIYAYWCIALTLLLGLGTFCWLAVVPVWKVRRVLVELGESSFAPACFEPDTRGLFARAGPRERLAVRELGGRENAAAALSLCLTYPQLISPDERKAIALLGSCGPFGVRPAVRSLDNKSDALRAEAATALGHIGPEAMSAAPVLISALSDPHVLVRDRAAWALGRMRYREAVAPLIIALRSRSGGLRVTAANALGEIGDARAVAPLVAMLHSEHAGLQWPQIDASDPDAQKIEALYVQGLLASAVVALERIEDPTSTMALIDACGHSAPNVSRIARSALKKLYSPEPRGPGRLRAYNKGEVLRVYQYYDCGMQVGVCRSVRMRLFALSMMDAGAGAGPLLVKLYDSSSIPGQVILDSTARIDQRCGTKYRTELPASRGARRSRG
jgi:HEAT repeat protein